MGRDARAASWAARKAVGSGRAVAGRSTWFNRLGIVGWPQIAFEVSGGTLQARRIELAAASDESVLGYFHFEATRPGASLDQDGPQRFVVRNGKILSLDNMWADGAAVDTFYQ
jgi:hypothetical protein